MQYTRTELKFIRNTLLAKRAYRNMEIPHDAVVWYGWMQSLLDRIEQKLHSSRFHDDNEILT